MSILSLVFAIWFVPELKGRALEEVDEMFKEFHWGWQYKHLETHGYGAQIARLAAGDRTAALEVENRKDTDSDRKVRQLCWVGLIPGRYPARRGRLTYRTSSWAWACQRG